MSRGIRRAVLIAVTVLLAGPVCVPPAAATTTTSPDGTVVTIHVPIDIVVVGADVVTDAQRKTITELTTMAQDFFWNPALKDLEYGDCLTFQLDLQVEVHPDVQYTLRDPIPHQIEWWDDPNVDSVVLIPGDPDHTRDHRSPFDGFVTGQFGDLDVPTFVHELGHLLGLGDDYVRVPDDSDQGWHAEDKPGREGTVMGKSIWGRWGGRELPSIDQNIVDRLGELAGEVVDLPLCPDRVVWQGVETHEVAYTYSGRVSAHLGNVNEYFHKITVRFTYVEETDAEGTMRWVSRKIDWEAKGKALARDFTVTTCEGSGSIELGPTGSTWGAPDRVTAAQREQLTIPCETTDFGILMGPFQKPPDRIEPPPLRVNQENLRDGCSYSEERPGYRYSVSVHPGCK